MSIILPCLPIFQPEYRPILRKIFETRATGECLYHKGARTSIQLLAITTNVIYHTMVICVLALVPRGGFLWQIRFPAREFTLSRLLGKSPALEIAEATFRSFAFFCLTVCVREEVIGRIRSCLNFAAIVALEISTNRITMQFSFSKYRSALDAKFGSKPPE